LFSKSFLHKICEYRIYILSLQHQTIINNVVMSNDKKTIKEMRANTTFMARLAKVRRVAAAL
jgi:hypothetical protein